MKRPILRFFFEIAVAFVLVAALGVFALTTRLDKGPLSLEPILPEIAGFVSDLAPGLRFEIGQAELRHGKGRIVFEIALRDITVLNDKNAPIGSLTAMQMGYSWRNILQFAVVPRVLVVESPTVVVTRFLDGHIGFNLQGEDKKQAAEMPELARLMSRAPAALREIQVRDAWIRFSDQKDKVEARLSKGEIALTRRGPRVEGAVSAHIAIADFEQDIKGEIIYDPYRDVTQFSAAMQGIKPDRIMALFPELPDELHIETDLDLMATAIVDRAFQPVGVDIRLSGEKGTIRYAPHLPKDIPLSGLVGVARYNPLDGSLNIDEISFNLFNGATASLTARRVPVVQDDKKVNQIEMVGLLSNFPVDELKYAWPQALASDAQEWVTTNITGGVVPRAAVSIKGVLDSEKNFTVASLDGKLNFEGLTVGYLSPMPPVTNVVGEAQYDADNFNLTITGGDLFDTKLTAADIRISGLSVEDQDIEMNLELDGPIRDAITTISSEPLQFPQEMGLTPQQFSGRARTKLWVKFPLLKDLLIEQVEMKTEAIVDDLVLRNVVKDLGVSGSGLIVEADTEKMSVRGKANIAGGAVDLAWQEFFGEAEETTILDIEGAVTPDALEGLRLPGRKYFSGEAQAKLRLTQDKKKTVRVTAEADLAKAKMTVAELSGRKEVGVPGSLSLKIISEDNGPTSLSDLQAEWQDFSIADGTARWNKNGDMESASLMGLRSGRMKADIVAKPLTGRDGVELTLTGDTLDLSDYWTRPPEPKEKDAAPDTRPFHLRLRGKTVYLDPEIPLKDVQASLDFEGDDLVRGTLAASVTDGELLLKQMVQPDKTRQLSVTMKNAGLVLRALDATDSVRGGTFVLNGKSSVAKPKVISGRVSMTDFTVVKAPILARLINAFSPGGLIELLEGRGLVFGKLQSDIVLESPQVIRLKDGKVAGASLGMSFSGRIYRDRGELNLKGNIVPVEGLNKVVGKIPLVGQILTGLKGEGVIAFAYRIRGKTDDPEVTVNPLSVFTPGILRSIFFD